MLRRIVVMIFGYLIAAGVGAVFLIVSALFDPATRELGLASVMTGLFAAFDQALIDGDPADALGAVGFVIWAVIIATCAAPLAIAALIGEAAGVRSLVWYSGACGLLAGASPWIARAAKGLERSQAMTDAEGRLALLFFLTGALTGAIYWLIAGPGPKRAPVEDLTSSP
ncbi:hypothetical protein [Methylocystis echinoides]|jgi:hypothetical protein|uniref:hypothetical protein n=1 Tax=Methylocystis echinoides TaxID=29468 RepID=UPI003437C846